MAIHFKTCGLKNVWLLDGYRVHETKYGTSYSYEDIDGLYRAITVVVCKDTQAMTPEILRFLRKRLGYSQGELGKQLGYTSQAVAKWEKGTSSIPVAISKLLVILCLGKVAPKITLEEALATRPESNRIEFQYSNLGWVAVGDSQIDLASKPNDYLSDTHFFDLDRQYTMLIEKVSDPEFQNDVNQWEVSNDYNEKNSN